MVETRIVASGGEELGVGALLDDAAALDEEDLIGGESGDYKKAIRDVAGLN